MITDIHTDGRTDGRTHRPSCRDATAHLKRNEKRKARFQPVGQKKEANHLIVYDVENVEELGVECPKLNGPDVFTGG